MRQYRYIPPVRSQPQPEPTPPPSRLMVLWQHTGHFFSRFRSISLVVLGIAITLAAMLLFNMTQPPPQRLTQRDINAAVERALVAQKPKPSYASEAYEIIRPSVVRVETLFADDDKKEGGTIGTGVIITDSGLILTSLHIVKDAIAVRVIFADGSASAAVVMEKQPENDLAVLRPLIIPDDLVPATLSSSAMLHVGDEVVAVGNPFGINNSVSAGVVSGLRRNFTSPKTGQTLSNMIQFDAAVNPGNSGGPLVNRNGEVVGIVEALLNPNEQEVFIGIGFAVPIDTAAGVVGAPPY